MVSIGTLFAFLLVCLAVIHLRRTAPRFGRPFRTPGVPWVPLFGIFFSPLLMLGLPLATWLRLASFRRKNWAGNWPLVWV
jgi:basic amino acid/polyamine antiporter, APA family